MLRRLAILAIDAAILGLNIAALLDKPRDDQPAEPEPEVSGDDEALALLNLPAVKQLPLWLATEMTHHAHMVIAYRDALDYIESKQP